MSKTASQIIMVDDGLFLSDNKSGACEVTGNVSQTACCQCERVQSVILQFHLFIKWNLNANRKGDCESITPAIHQVYIVQQLKQLLEPVFCCVPFWPAGTLGS